MYYVCMYYSFDYRPCIGTVKAATFHFLNPFFGVAIAAMFLSEKLGPLDLVGVIIITGGILAVQLSKQKPQ